MQFKAKKLTKITVLHKEFTSQSKVYYLLLVRLLGERLLGFSPDFLALELLYSSRLKNATY